YILWTYQRVFTGTLPANTPAQDARGLKPLDQLPDLRGFERWAVVPLIAIMLVLGFWPAPALDLVRQPAVTTLEQVAVQDMPVTTATSEAGK
ncbi:MAG: hypothetical protein KJ548_08515, partial [Actinobacteria bacterium]|nr:hypothetical protein [Actinomycetota bacterium]